MATGRRFVGVAAAIGASALFVLMVPAVAHADSTPQDGWAHRSTETVSPDGFSVRSQEGPASPDGFSVRSQEGPVSPDGFSVRSQEPIGQDGFATVELPRPEVVLDGWAAGSTTESTLATGIDGWSYAAVSGEAPASLAGTDTAPPPRSSTPPFELLGMAAVLTAAAIAGVTYEIHRRRHHFSI